MPEPNDDVLDTMVEDFKTRHREGKVCPSVVSIFLKHCEALASAYSRYSCDNSDPKSIIDQLVNELERAKREGRFVPWAYVFADYSVSGFDPSRQGHTSHKKLLTDRAHKIDTVYIDDFSRASREEVEWWKLTSICRKHGKRLIGASDNFSLSSPNWQTDLKMYAFFSALLITNLQQKVRRGMRGAFRAGGVVGKLILGHARTPRLENGQPVLGPNEKVKMVRCVDPDTCQYKRLMYSLFLERDWSLTKIA
ncbi:MAG: recombinase family protein, partial [Pirellulales bacterium]|nr:recombinase family protein [Pirellulales bacterium]